jgi:hypothetical protein
MLPLRGWSVADVGGILGTQFSLDNPIFQKPMKIAQAYQRLNSSILLPIETFEGHLFRANYRPIRRFDCGEISDYSGHEVGFASRG